jgi:hypothetical protein
MRFFIFHSHLSMQNKQYRTYNFMGFLGDSRADYNHVHVGFDTHNMYHNVTATTGYVVSWVECGHDVHGLDISVLGLCVIDDIYPFFIALPFAVADRWISTTMERKAPPRPPPLLRPYVRHGHANVELGGLLDLLRCYRRRVLVEAFGAK